MDIELLSNQAIGAAIEVHRALGPGLLESVYQRCLCCELELRGIPYRAQVELPVVYKGMKLDLGFRLDILADEQLILELKAIDQLHPIHEAQLLAYLRLADLRLGLLINFNVPLLKNGIRRLIL